VPLKGDEQSEERGDGIVGWLDDAKRVEARSSLSLSLPDVTITVE
jgi:hypothetical protein